MYLFINNLLEDITKCVLIKDDGEVLIKKILKKDGYKGAKILNGIDFILSEENKSLKDITGIIVVSGPGAFSAIRKALSICNTIGWIQKIPVIGISNTNNLNELEIIKEGVEKIKDENDFVMALPFYGKEPNIS